SLFVGSSDHSAKFNDLERPAMLPYSLLAVEYRAARIQPYCDSTKQKNRTAYHQAQQGTQSIENPLSERKVKGSPRPSRWPQAEARSSLPALCGWGRHGNEPVFP